MSEGGREPVIEAMCEVMLDFFFDFGEWEDYADTPHADGVRETCRRGLRAALEAAGCERREKFPVFPETAVAELLRAADMEEKRIMTTTTEDTPTSRAWTLRRAICEAVREERHAWGDWIRADAPDAPDPLLDAWGERYEATIAAIEELENYARYQAHEAERHRKLRKELAEAYYGSTPAWNVDELVRAWGISKEEAE